MPVPSSYNDITTDSKLRDFIGWVWYETDFFVSRDWQTNKRVVLRFGSAHYNTIVVSTIVVDTIVANTIVVNTIVVNTIVVNTIVV